MTIIALHRITLCGLAADKRAVLEALQELGCMHLVPLRPPPAEPETAPPAVPVDAYRALRYLLDCPNPRRQARDPEGFDVDDVVRRALDNQAHLRRLQDRRDRLRQRIGLLEPWGEFEFPPLEALAGQRLWFYVVPHYQMLRVRASGLAWQVVRRDQRYRYVAVIAPDEPPAAAMPVKRSRVGALSLGELRRRLERVEAGLEDIVAERQALSRWVLLLRANLARAEDRAALAHAAGRTLDRDGVFAVQGWAPVPELPRLREFARRQGLALLAEAPGPEATPPTLLDTPEALAGGQEVVGFYQLPGYRDWDPSGVIFFSFALFFAMILADAGYAVLLGLALLALRGRFQAGRSGRRLWRLGWAIAATGVVYGVLVGSYFGAAPPPGSLPAALRVLDVDDFDTMMRLAVGVGVAHLLLANAVLARRAWPGRQALPPLGWMAVLLGGLWLGLGGGGPGHPGAWLLGAGLGLVFVGAGQGPWRRPGDWLRRIGAGLLALTRLSKLFGDALSYLRLFALGLASASLALTFNQLALQVKEHVAGIGVLLAVLILVAGHGLNFLLCLVSGLVHGLRLNLIEFYNWGIPGEGHPFKSFARKEVEPWKH